MIVLEAYGRRVGVTGPEVALQQALGSLPAPYAVTGHPAERSWAVIDHEPGEWVAATEGEVISRHRDVSSATEAMLSDVELWVAEYAEEVVFVHAGCVVVDGAAIVLPGYSRSGKSSLTAALTQAGASYYSDEFAVLREDGSVVPYARPLSLRVRDGAGVKRVDPAALGGTRVGNEAATVSLIAALRYDQGSDWAVEPVTGSQAVLALLEQAVPARRRPEATLDAVTRAVHHAIVLAGTRGEADEAAPRLLELLAERSGRGR